MIRVYIAFTGFVLFYFTGCASIGPGTVTRDRFDYVTAISDSWKSQMLFNLVKLRYGDAPVFLDVASVINQYLVEGVVCVSGTGSESWGPRFLALLPYNFLGTGRYGETHNHVFAHQRRKVCPQSHDSNPACGHTQFSTGRISGRSSAAARCAYDQWHSQPFRCLNAECARPTRSFIRW